ncbi:MAG: hypothetical protein IJJ42_03160 [Clostridia bacterium]|nr:hypothetical protein [Clostridia bacterium]
MIIVARDGSGDYTSLQAAIDAAPEGVRAPTLILVRPGLYEERVVVHKDNLRIVGADAASTVITGRACAKDLRADGTEKTTFLSATLLTSGRNIEVENLTVRNDAGDGREVGQAVAVYAAGDRGVWRNCRFIAHQDTLYCGPLRVPDVVEDIAPRDGSAERCPRVQDGPLTRSRQYFDSCWIQGDVDFIFGAYRCWFENCTLFMNERGGYYTAANTHPDQPHGFVFSRCRLTGACAAGAGYLGRPWRRGAATVFLACEMDEHVAPSGFADWDAGRPVTERCGEWHTSGAQADSSARHPAQKRLSDEEAAQLTPAEVLSGFDGWEPERRIPTWFMCGDSTMADYPEESAPMTGWGQALQSLLPAGVFVQNEAMNGRSSKSFIDERRLENIDACLRPGDKLIVSFSHNDEKADPLRHTSPEETFPAYLMRYIQTARNHGAEPVLATPICRRNFSPEGHLILTHGAYPQAIRDLAERENIRMVDLEKATAALLRREGPEGTTRFFCHVPAGSRNYPEGLKDNSHQQLAGAVRIAQFFLQGLRGLADWEDEPVTEDAGTRAFDSLISREDSVVKK